MEIVIDPALVVVISRVYVVPLPVSAPLVASPVPSVTLIFDAAKPVIESLKTRVNDVVVGDPAGVTELSVTDVE